MKLYLKLTLLLLFISSQTFSMYTELIDNRRKRSKIIQEIASIKFRNIQIESARKATNDLDPEITTNLKHIATLRRQVPNLQLASPRNTYQCEVNQHDAQGIREHVEKDANSSQTLDRDISDAFKKLLQR